MSICFTWKSKCVANVNNIFKFSNRRIEANVSSKSMSCIWMNLISTNRVLYRSIRFVLVYFILKTHLKIMTFATLINRLIISQTWLIINAFSCSMIVVFHKRFSGQMIVSWYVKNSCLRSNFFFPIFPKKNFWENFLCFLF